MKKLLLLLLLLLSALGHAQELVTLAVPVATPNQTNVRFERLMIDMVTKTVFIQWQIRTAANVVLSNGSASYPTPAIPNACTPAVDQPSGATLITTLNTSNLTANSLVKRSLTRLMSDCYIAAGTISGTPE